MIVPRHRLDVSPADLLFALAAAALSRGADRRAERIASDWAQSNEALTCSSVRAGFDCLLSALDLPAGDEVLFTAVTHPDMPRIVAAHGLVPVPVDIEVATTAPRAHALEQALSPRARAIVVAHLFGGRVDLSQVEEVARRHGLLVIEDCAQTILGPNDAGDPGADVSLYSFGSIKTATALGGALVRVRDPVLLSRMREIEAGWPRQPRREHALKSLKYTALVLLDRPAPYTAVVHVARAAGFDLDRFVSTTVRAFKGWPEDEEAAYARWLRRRPSVPLLALLERRLRRFDTDRLTARRRVGAHVAAGLPLELERPGRRLPDSTYWVFPILSADPDGLVRTLRESGFDATRGTSAIATVEPPAGRGDLEPEQARRLMAGIVFLPVYPELPIATLDRLAEAVRRAELLDLPSVPAEAETVTA